MRALVAFLLSVLGCSLAAGRLFSKCDLKKAFDNQTTSDKLQRLDCNFMAKIVYYAERKSGFNTSVVTHEPEDHSSERRREEGGVPQPRDKEVPTFYGLFQLSNLLACSDGPTESPNICSMDCNNFIDDDISDDIKCLSKVHSSLMNNPFGGQHSEKLQQRYKHIYQECRNITSHYLDECV